MLDGYAEVSVVAYPHGQVHLDVLDVEQGIFRESIWLGLRRKN